MFTKTEREQVDKVMATKTCRDWFDEGDYLEHCIGDKVFSFLGMFYADVVDGPITKHRTLKAAMEAGERVL